MRGGGGGGEELGPVGCAQWSRENRWLGDLVRVKMEGAVTVGNLEGALFKHSSSCWAASEILNTRFITL